MAIEKKYDTVNRMWPVHPVQWDRRFSYHITRDWNRTKPEWPATLRENPYSLTLTKIVGGPSLPIQNRWNGYFIGPGAEHSISPPENASFCLLADINRWNPRLYAQAYTKFASAARQGSAEWGMNIVQGRKALSTLIQLTSSAATAMMTLHNSYRFGAEYLKKYPKTTAKSVEKRSRHLYNRLRREREMVNRVRLSNEIFVLEQVSGLFIAWRYGVKPIMTDIMSTVAILSGEMDDVTLRKAAKMPWSGYRAGPGGGFHNTWTGTESVVLKATVKVSNPNLALMNRMGIVNPQYWLWDSTPWSFMIDWFLPVGSFLSNLTATVGLTLDGASITRTRSADVKLDAVWKGVEGWPVDSGEYLGYVKRKVRVVGSLPIPLSVPYGTGLGIERAQNSLALMGAKWSKMLKINLR